MFKSKKLSVATLLVLFALSHSARGATIGFKPAVNYPVGTKPVAVAAGDFDRDGKMDLAVVNSGDASARDDGGVSILLGNGDGTFRAAVNISAGKNPTSIAVADFNGDNRLDLAVINADGGGKVGILLGNGDGTFQSLVDYAVASQPTMVAVGDFNGDHKTDLVVNASSLSVLVGNGDGTFQSHLDFGMGGRGIVVADFNGDGIDDLSVSGTSVLIFLSNGDGTFQSATAYDGGGFLSGPEAIAAGDFNGDGNLDVLVDFRTFNGESTTYGGDLLEGNGDGTFRLLKGVVTLPGDGSMTAADFNGDGRLDLTLQPWVLGTQQSDVWVGAGNGDGTFQPAITFAVGSSPSQVVNADLNGDKSPDLVVTNTGDNTISVLLNTVSTDFSVSASALSPDTVSPGQSATSTVSLSLLNTFDNPVLLTCSVQPIKSGSPTCSLNPNSVTFDSSGKASAQFTVTAGTASASLTRPSVRQDSKLWEWLWLPIAGLAVAGAGFGRNKSSPRRPLGLFAGCFLITGLIFQAACSGGSIDSKTQSYTVTVTAASGAMQHSTTVTLRVH